MLYRDQTLSVMGKGRPRQTNQNLGWLETRNLNVHSVGGLGLGLAARSRNVFGDNMVVQIV